MNDEMNDEPRTKVRYLVIKEGNQQYFIRELWSPQRGEWMLMSKEIEDREVLGVWKPKTWHPNSKKP